MPKISGTAGDGHAAPMIKPHAQKIGLGDDDRLQQQVSAGAHHDESEQQRRCAAVLAAARLKSVRCKCVVNDFFHGEETGNRMSAQVVSATRNRL
jgi:hypothetical protein